MATNLKNADKTKGQKKIKKTSPKKIAVKKRVAKRESLFPMQTYEVLECAAKERGISIEILIEDLLKS